MYRSLPFFCLLAVACSESTEPASDTPWQGRHAHTLAFGAADNSEVVKFAPDGKTAILVASKARKVTLLAVSDQLTEVRSAVLFPDDTSESELTHIDIDSEGRFAVVTRTLPVVDDGSVVDCQGEVVFIDVSDTSAFGVVLARRLVGPMPDAVDISDNNRWVVTADEVDFNDGKCPVSTVQPTITVLELPGGEPTPVHRATITVTQGLALQREPEQIIFAADNDRVAVTLQDTHEALFFRVSEAIAAVDDNGMLSSDNSLFTAQHLPNRPDGAEPWPDGVSRVIDGDGVGHFAIAGEFNDTLHFYSLDGVFEHQHVIDNNALPSDLPRNLEDWSKAPFRPDSLAPFQRGDRSYLAASLKHAGAVGVWDVSDIKNVRLSAAIKIGVDDTGTPTTESSVGCEGIAATADGHVVTANEGDSTVSLVLPIVD